MTSRAQPISGQVKPRHVVNALEIQAQRHNRAMVNAPIEPVIIHHHDQVIVTQAIQQGNQTIRPAGGGIVRKAPD